MSTDATTPDVRPVRSFVEGGWREGDGGGTVLRNAATGAPVATISASVTDPAAALAYARDVGGPALRAMTFVERAAVLKSLARDLGEHGEEFAALSACTGATARDTGVDVDGGVATLAVLASKAAKGLPESTVLPDGDVEPLGKTGAFAARHIRTSRPGVAVQINAFNFPVWGMLEKFAPAFLAGMPSLVKPATPTAYLTEAVVRRMLESELLPEGSLSLLCGSPGGLVDALTSQDVVSFTGSAGTAALLRSHPTVVGRSVTFNAEADSINASILGPEVEPGDPELELFVDQVVTEMTVKTGQKCTAIRRAFVPERLAPTVLDMLSARLADVVVGHPGHPDTRMGPLVTVEHREEVRDAIDRLTESARIVQGDPRAVPDSVAATGGDPERGAFLAPVVLECDDLRADAPHRVEAFGPVVTVLPYGGSDDLPGAVAQADGCLVASVVTHDPSFARGVVAALAPWNGRILVVDRDSAAESTGHGIVMPTLVHGGPGRAGGGEELGGLRALDHYMQRTAVQGGPALLESL